MEWSLCMRVSIQLTVLLTGIDLWLLKLSIHGARIYIETDVHAT